MSMMDKLKQMLKGHGDRMGQGHDTRGRTVDETMRGRPGQGDKGPDAIRDQFQPPQDRDNPPRP
ncbi:antitoxin [Streptomyces sp. NPDC096198]|uniref:antitoxin n=1 Tax=Streptomyces sp. NPDC096198 TaxID=3366080 RepID=UPI0038012B4C